MAIAMPCKAQDMDCPLAKPEVLAKKTDFSRDESGQSATEHVTLPNAIPLTLHQDGCETYTVTAQYILPENATKPLAYWYKKAFDLLKATMPMLKPGTATFYNFTKAAEVFNSISRQKYWPDTEQATIVLEDSLIPVTASLRVKQKDNTTMTTLIITISEGPL